MAMTIQGNSYLSISRNISDERIKHIEEARSKEEAIAMGVWDKIKDWFCGTRKSEALGYIYDLIHNDQMSNTESVLQRIEAFYHLSTIASDTYKDKFQATITENSNGTWEFEFSITNALKTQCSIDGKNENNMGLFFAKIESFLEQQQQQQNIGTSGVALCNQGMAKLAGLEIFKVVLVNKCASFQRIVHLISTNTQDTDVLVLKKDFSGQLFFSFADKKAVDQSPDLKEYAADASSYLLGLEEIKDYMRSYPQTGSTDKLFTAEKLTSIKDFNLEKLKMMYKQALPSSMNLDEVYKTPSEVTFRWMSVLRDAASRFEGRARDVVLDLLKTQQSRYMQHKQLTLSATRDSLINDCVILRREQLDALADIANPKEDGMFSSLVAQLPASDKDLHPTRLHDNIYGRVFESNWMAGLVANPPPEVIYSMNIIAKYFSDYLDGLSSQKQETVTVNLRKQIVSDQRFWFKQVPNMERLSDAGLEWHTYLQELQKILRSEIKSGEQCIAIPYLSVKLFNAANKINFDFWRIKTNTNYMYNIKPRTGRTVESMECAEANVIQVSIPTAGITMRHQPPAVSDSDRMTITVRPSLRYHIPSSDKIDKFPSVKNALWHGLPYSGGVSGSTGIMLAIIEKLKEDGKKIDLRMGLLGTIMFVNYDGGHSIHESLWVANQKGLELGRVTSKKENADEFVSDYEAFQALYSGTECANFIAKALSKAWADTDKYLITNSPDYKKLTIPQGYKNTI